jgi:heme exporter protein B
MPHLLLHELNYYFKNFYELIYIYGFFAISLLIVPLGLNLEGDMLKTLHPALLILAVLMGIALGSTNLYQRDAEQGLLEQYQLTLPSLYGVILAKFIAFYLVISVPLLLILPALLSLAGVGLGAYTHYAAGLLATAAALTILCQLASVLTAGLERARAILMLLILPLAAPVMIFGSHYLRQPELWRPELLFLTAFSIFLLPLLCLAGSACIRASH